MAGPLTATFRAINDINGWGMVQVRDAKIKVLSSLPVSTKEEREEWEKLADSLKVNILNCSSACI